MPMEGKDIILLKSLQTFFAHPENLRALTGAFNDEALSLRVIDWACTNWSKTRNAAWIIEDECGERAWNLFLEYKSMLKSFSKRLFDPFKRRDRIEFIDSDDKKFTTTVAQLNFFRWAIRYDVLNYCKNNLRDIERDMIDRTKAGSATKGLGVTSGNGCHVGKPRRRQLSKAAVHSCTTTKLRVKINFK
jgi:hypothetical protein